MQVLVVLAQGQAPVPFTYEQLYAAATQGHVNPQAMASLDNGATWVPVWQLAQMQPPMAMPAPVAQKGSGRSFLRLIVPVDRPFSAILAGYMGLGGFMVALYWVAIGGLKNAGQQVSVAGGVLVTLLGIGATLAVAILAQRTIRKNPGKHGMGRVGFAYVGCGVALVAMLSTLLK